MTTINITLDPGATQPTRAHDTDAGFDLHALTGGGLAPGARTLVHTGVHLGMAPGWEAQIRPRSGLALRHGITVLNTPGTIDAGYRGDVGVILHNTDQDKWFHWGNGDRIAQITFHKVPPVNLEVWERLPDTDRGDNGFGSTGIKAVA